MKELVLILPEEPSSLLCKMIDSILKDLDYITITSNDGLINLQNKQILFAIELNEIGGSNNLNNIFLELYSQGHDSLLGSQGALLVHSNFSMFTKSFAQSTVFLANNLGCGFVGRPLVEATKDLENLLAMKKVYNMSLEEICLHQSSELGKRFLDNKGGKTKVEKLLILHSSSREISNTLSLWDMVKSNLKGIEINEINVGNGNIMDCKGCSYKTCKFLGKQSKCFYGGLIVEEVYPAILESSSILFICPNYNDMITANLVATINRFTALYRQTKFYDKSIYSIIVSGYSGGDAIGKQLISSLNMNKTFRLPPYFSLMATANDRGAIKNVKDIQKIAKNFALKIMN